MTRWIYHFDDPLPEGSDHRDLLGGKGAGLRQMKQAGLAVPPGFTISSQCCIWRAHWENEEINSGRCCFK